MYFAPCKCLTILHDTVYTLFINKLTTTQMNNAHTTIEFYAKNVYGEIKFYIKDAELAAKVQALTGNKTLTDNNMKALEALGFAFTEVIAPR